MGIFFTVLHGFEGQRNGQGHLKKKDVFGERTMVQGSRKVRRYRTCVFLDVRLPLTDERGRFHPLFWVGLPGWRAQWPPWRYLGALVSAMVVLWRRGLRLRT